MVQVKDFSEERRSNFWAAIHQIFGSGDNNISRSKVSARAEFDAKLAILSLRERVCLAFKELPPNETEERLVTALMQRPGADSLALSHACGWTSPIWHTHFALMCQRRAELLLPQVLPDEPEIEFLSGILVEYNSRRGSFRFKDEAESAFRSMGLG